MMLTSKDRFRASLKTHAVSAALLIVGLILTIYSAVLVAGWAD
jgi:hypothetical protein